MELNIKEETEKLQVELEGLARQIQQVQQQQQVLMNEALKKQGALELLQEMEKDEV